MRKLRKVLEWGVVAVVRVMWLSGHATVYRLESCGFSFSGCLSLVTLKLAFY